MRFFSLLIALCCVVLPVRAETFLQRLLDRPVPGGVAVLNLGDAAQAPQVRYRDRPVMVLRDGPRWIAVVGIPLDVAAGRPAVQVKGQGALEFEVRDKRYAEQHIKLANQRQLTSSPA